jgi:hypothetical protein
LLAVKKSSMNYLEEIVIPICLYKEENNQAKLISLCGTAFFINNLGIFLTARHVIENAKATSLEKNLKIGLNVKGNNPKNNNNVICPLLQYDFAPEGFDIAIGTIKYLTESAFHWGKTEPSIWKEIATVGYPEAALIRLSCGSVFIPTRGHRGYIQRLIEPNELPHLGKHHKLLELSFPITKGLSGAPLFYRENNRNYLAGVCIGSYSSEIVDYANELTEITKEGEKEVTKEKKVKIIECGITQDIKDLENWKPELLSGSTLRGVMSCSYTSIKQTSPQCNNSPSLMQSSPENRYLKQQGDNP